MNNELKILSKEILSGDNKEKFKTFSIETAGGKTYTSVQSFRMDIDNDLTNKKYLFVTKFKDECIRIAQDINDGYKDIKAKVFVVDNELKDKYTFCTNNIYNIRNCKVLIITHKTYCNISNPITDKHKELRNIINEEFHTMVIDEEINPIKNSLFEFNKTIIIFQDLLNSYSKIYGDEFGIYIKPLLDELNKAKEYKPNNQLHRIVNLEIDTMEIIDLKKKLEFYISTISEEWFEDKSIEKFGNLDKINRVILLEVVGNIFNTYLSICDAEALIHISEGKIYSYNYDFEYLMLHNNIWLDASSCFNTMYLCDKFELIETERVIDHSSCKVKVFIENTTTSKKNADKEFRTMISDYINKNTSDEDKGLVLTKKTECIQLNNNEKYLKDNKNVSFLNFENMRGVDNFKDYTQCFYIHTYRMSPAYYVFLYEYFTKERVVDGDMEVGTKGKTKAWGFKNNDKLKDLMLSDMISSMYQGLKRVQRNKNPKATFHIFTKETEVIAMTLMQMKNLVSKDLIEIMDNKPKTAKETLIDWIENEWDKKRLNCADVRDILDIGEKTWRNIWKDEEFVKLMKSKRVKIGYTKHSKKAMYLMKY